MSKANIEDASAGSKHWHDDLLGRETDSNILIEFLLARVEERKSRGVKSAYVLNIDAKYGHGKSYFLERFRRDLEDRKYPVASINAWEDDFADDPLTPIMSGIEASFAKFKPKLKSKATSLVQLGSKIAVTATKQAAITLGKRALGDGLSQIVDMVRHAAGASESQTAEEPDIKKLIEDEANAAIQQFMEAKQSIKEFKQKLAEILSDNALKTPLFVLIDELDRCRPTYAITLLERVKHLFDVADVVFVIATDTEQLRHSVCSVYGHGFDGSAYLLRFFNRTYRFPQISNVRFFEKQMSEYGIGPGDVSSPPLIGNAIYLDKMRELFQLGLREIERSFDILRSCVTVWSMEHKLPLELTWLFPLIVLYCRDDLETFEQLSRCETAEFARRYSQPPVLVPFDQFPDDPFSHRPREKVLFPLIDLITKFIAESKHSLPQITRTPHSKQPASWIQERYTHEFVTIHHRQYNSGNEPKTVCFKYPELIRKVGAFSPKEV